MKVLLSARGSRGDVQPIISVAEEFKRRGHDVSLCLPGTFEKDVQGKGLGPAFYSEDSHQMMDRFGSGWSGLKKTLEWFSRTIDDQFRVMVPVSEDADLLVTGTNEIAAPSVAEYRDVPFYRITFAPMMTGRQSHPLLPWQSLPGVVNRTAWQGINTGVDLIARGPINRNRAELGMDKIQKVGEFVARHGHTLFAMNTTMAPPCPSWGKSYDFTFTGYCHSMPKGRLEEDLERFIEDGSSPPVYVGFGSVSLKRPRRFTQMTIDASVQSGCRIVLGAGWTGLGYGALSKGVFVVGDVPHGLLFPRVAGVVHHGGAGTTHTAARAGVPQMILPQFADQFYWGHRAAALGLGPSPIPPDRLTSRRFAQLLTAISEDPRYARHAAALGHAMRSEDGVSSVVDAVESRQGFASAAVVDSATDNTRKKKAS